jgi:hypothetical protein
VNAKSGTHDDDTIRTGNWLPPLSAVGAALVGIFLLLGAYGHLEAVLPAVAGEGGAGTFRLLLPGTPTRARRHHEHRTVQAALDWQPRRRST